MCVIQTLTIHVCESVEKNVSVLALVLMSLLLNPVMFSLQSIVSQIKTPWMGEDSDDVMVATGFLWSTSSIGIWAYAIMG